MNFHPFQLSTGLGLEDVRSWRIALSLDLLALILVPPKATTPNLTKPMSLASLNICKQWLVTRLGFGLPRIEGAQIELIDRVAVRFGGMPAALLAASLEAHRASAGVA